MLLTKVNIEYFKGDSDLLMS